ncbi:hypothetical protein J2800_000508 [Caulobacter rhizosphaerae]|uniref:Uncharacterized protein n=1 Tax=Caulobacter rhizosphaerae TaxID=2010972 RepID=A0ABU1MUB4_9CAUL|nr:hypothetical protein [Caulobacter rhizosphaerae]
MASDRCGGGGRSSGTGLEGVTSACPGPSIVGEPARRRRRTGIKREYAHRPAPPAAGFSRKGSRPGPAKPQQGCPPDAGGKRARGAIGFVETVFIKNSGRCPALRVPFHQLSERSREDERSCRRRPPQSLRDSSPRGGAATRCGGRSDPPPLGEVARRAGGGSPPVERKPHGPAPLQTHPPGPAPAREARLYPRAVQGRLHPGGDRQDGPGPPRPSP